ncbi:MAG: SGNH/GDSL hydrolase family protein, partial [Patescibacteria group bacterium]|nr:SGNH/GDSL hydrolase family protein [Patescibacteria group bacterium]
DHVQTAVPRYAEYPAGARVRFRTDSASMGLRIDHGNDRLSWKVLSVTAMAGIELYEGPPGRMIFRQLATPASGTEPYEVRFSPFPDRRMRDITLYLPMYAKLKSLDIALDPDAKVEPPSPFALTKPVVFYGTSFIQGGCASRGSMNLPSQVGRLLAIDTINLGFAGDGRCEPEVAQLVAEIDAACFVMGPILNNLDLMRENYPRFVATLRQRWPDRPILLMTRLHAVGQSEPYEVNALVREVYEKMQAAGDRNVHYFDSFPLYADGSVHPTVEGLHPSDLGFKIIADALAPALGRVCELPNP